MSRALECFWEGGKYEKVAEVADLDPRLRGRVECRLSMFLGDVRNESGSALQLLHEIVELGSNNASVKTRLGQDGWPPAMKILLERASDSLEGKGDQGRWTTLTKIHVQLMSLGVAVDDMQRARALLGAGSQTNMCIVS